MCFEDVYIIMVGLTVDSQCFRAACSDLYPAAEITCQLHRTLVSTTEHRAHAHASCTKHWPARRRATTKPHVLCRMSIASEFDQKRQRMREPDTQRAREPESQRARGFFPKKVAVEPAWAIERLQALQPQLPKVAI